MDINETLRTLSARTLDDQWAEPHTIGPAACSAHCQDMFFSSNRTKTRGNSIKSVRFVVFHPNLKFRRRPCEGVRSWSQKAYHWSRQSMAPHGIDSPPMLQQRC
eukprot:3115886-Amphidinium_carterae.1